MPNVPYLIPIVPMCPSCVFLKLIPCVLPKLISYLLPWVLMSPPCCSPLLLSLYPQFFVQNQYSSHLYNQAKWEQPCYSALCIRWSTIFLAWFKLYKNVMPTRLILNWGHKHIGDTVTFYQLAINRAHLINQKEKKKKRMHHKHNWLIGWITLNQPSIINVGLASI